jgi:hypothetical protein
MITIKKSFSYITLLAFVISCGKGKDENQIRQEVQSLAIIGGEITLCGSGEGGFGTVTFSQGCSDNVKSDFNLAIALLHSFEYTEAEKVFARIIENDPHCVFGYWGVAMCNFHPLWAPPSPVELKKGAKVIRLARQLVTDPTSRESAYLEAIATIYDNWETTDHRSRVSKFEEASKKIYVAYGGDEEAGIFYALALAAAADPKDKTFAKQKKAGEILSDLFAKKPDHPGVAHYLIHNYDYPELAELGLSAARKYASVAPASAHAQHMPSHIFTRLGLWDESILSNINSVSSAKCYAENSGMKRHWDEELHGLDYLTYAYLQQANDALALEQVEYLNSIEEVFPVNFKDAYCFAATPARYAVERKDWTRAAQLSLAPSTFPWDKFPWESEHAFCAFTRARSFKEGRRGSQRD